jgi:hypothetical protein
MDVSGACNCFDINNPIDGSNEIATLADNANVA